MCSYNCRMNTANPLLAGHTLPAFDAIRPEHVETGIRELLEDSRERVRQIEVRAFEKLQKAMQRIAVEKRLIPA